MIIHFYTFNHCQFPRSNRDALLGNHYNTVEVRVGYLRCNECLRKIPSYIDVFKNNCTLYLRNKTIKETLNGRCFLVVR